MALDAARQRGPNLLIGRERGRITRGRRNIMGCGNMICSRAVRGSRRRGRAIRGAIVAGGVQPAIGERWMLGGGGDARCSRGRSAVGADRDSGAMGWAAKVGKSDSRGAKDR